ncbi:DUF551 domain-containing protein [Rhizobium sp. 18065]|uniref:DUF551 domain-containing protein n=1 Tax=Rhizobium sp. 18065 TaxID=2681411 RepID=UPI001356DC8F|nr:DUF551 domain-containing protein [Rhizobium sp. 18065]
MKQNKHDDMCPCTRFRAQDEFCTCGAVARDEIVKDTSRRFGERLREIQRTPSPQPNLSGWQDISTAPKNTKVLAAYRNEVGNWRIVTACYHTQLEWSDEYGDHEQEYAPEDWYEENDSSEVIYPCSRQPTHWQPLPAPPTTTEGSAG